MAGNVETVTPEGLPPRPVHRSSVSIDLEDEIISPPLKSNRVYSGSVSTTYSNEDVLEGVLVVRPTRKWVPPIQAPSIRLVSATKSQSDDANLGKRYAAFLSLAYLSSKCKEINQEHADFEVLISSHFEKSQRRLEEIKDRLSSRSTGQ